ncbi:MAG: DUF1697 domain-containing protein, partial [Actinomycetota bacterium]
MSTRCVALLRGINVGGKNIISMADLRAVFEAEGYDEVQTYIQSGNVVFATDQPPGSLEQSIEAALVARLDTAVKVVVRSPRQMRGVVAKAPDGFGSDRDRYLSDVVFLRKGLTPKRALAAVSLRDGVDQVWPGTGVLYFARLAERRSQSRVSRQVSTPEYQPMTNRNRATTTRQHDKHNAESSTPQGTGR